MRVNNIKILLAAILFGIGLAQAATAQTCAPAPVGLVSTFSGDNNALDARSRNNGTIQGNVTYAAGQVGQAFQFGGGNGDRVLVGNPANLQFQQFTIEAWIKRSSSSVVSNSPNASSPAGIFFAYGQSGYAFLIDQNTNKLGLSQVGVSQTLSPNLTITDTNWHHVAVTRIGRPITGGSQTVFYLDGVADTPTAYAPQFSFSTNAAIGSRGDGVTDNVFFGAIDELTIYDRALSAAEIAAIAGAGTAGKCKPLATTAPDNQVLWLAGDGDAADSTGNVGGATLQNGAGYQVGKVGQGFKFDGADDQITVPHNANQNGGTNLTIEAWVNSSGSFAGQTILQKRSSANIGGYTLEYSGNQSLQFCVQISGAYQCVSGANILPDVVWSHVAATYDGAAIRVYVGGIQILSQAQTGAIDAVSDPIVIGRNIVNGNAFQGALDEIGLYNRALSAAEIGSISNAGLAGKYKVQSTVPTNIAAWYPGDGNPNDIQAGNTATLQGGAAYAGGKVGQAFSLNGTNAYVTAPSTPANDPTGAGAGASMEAWVYFNRRPSETGRQFYIISKSGTGATEGFDIHVDPDNFFKFVWQNSYTGFPNTAVQAGVWYHVVATFDPNTLNPTAGVRLYLNGVFQGTGNVLNPRTASNVPLEIGYSTALGGNRYFNGLIDEAGVYSRALTPNEIRDLFYAGSGGKYKAAANPTVSNKAKTGDVEITLANLTTAGAAHATPLNSTQLPALPVNYTSTGLIYDIATSASFTGAAQTCFSLPSFTDQQTYGSLRVLHLESGVWVNRTSATNFAAKTVCASTASLSPFAVAFAPPTAGGVTVGGRVTTVFGEGIPQAIVSLTDANGDSQTILATKFGNFRFRNVPAGASYIISVRARRYRFSQPTQVVFALEDRTDINFVALP